MTTRKILIVDDSTTRRKGLQTLLIDRQFEIHEANTAEEAMELLAKVEIPVIITDTELPTRSGLFLLQEIKAYNEYAEVILVTHNASSFNVLQALRSGAFDFIVRPIDTSEILLNVIDRAFTQIELRTQNAFLLDELEKKNRSLSHSLKMIKALNESIERLSTTLDVTELLTRLLDLAMKELQAKRGFLALARGKDSDFGIKISRGIPPVICQEYHDQLPQGLMREITKRNKPVLVPNKIPPQIETLANGVERKHLLVDPGLLAAHLVRKGRTIGVVLLLGHPEGTPFEEQDLHFLIQLSHHATLALEKAGMIHKLQREKVMHDAVVNP